MRDLIAFDRRNQILAYLRENHRASTRTLSDLFQVSEVTIRHDLQMLEDQGWIERIHGGAQISPRWVQELPLSIRESQNQAIKRQIAQATLGFIQNGDTILIDSSTTAFQLTTFLTDYQNLTIVSNNFYIAQVLAPVEHIEVIIVGGSVRGLTGSVVGPLAEDFIANLRVDKAFFGAAGVSLQRGFTDADSREVQIKRRMAQSANEVHVLVDQSKFGKESFSITFPFEQVHRVITDHLPSEFEIHLSHLGISTYLVPNLLK